MPDAAFLESIAAARRLRVLFVGQCDSGKTTLVAQAARHALRNASVSVVDADVGQSHIGPPTTIAWAKADQPFDSLSDLKMESMYFVGSTSPQFHLLPTALGTIKIVSRAACAADKVLIDTPGFIRGEAARQLLWHIVDSVQPEIVVAVQQAGELQHILSPYARSSSPHVIEIPQSPDCVEKTREQRTEYREALFRRYFADSAELTLCWDDAPVKSRGVIDECTALSTLHRLVSLRSSAGEDMALGIITGVDPANHRLVIRTPWAVASMPASVVLGSLRLTPDGKEIPWPEGTSLPVP